jgi:asparagine synthase (glutamine-hydrolysing)
MCGIFGVFDSGQIENQLLKHALDCLDHRGPDDRGFYEDEFVRFSMCRLAIIDIATGKQPVFSQSGTAIVIFNGQIYNFKELRSQLIAKGYEFKSVGDAEVIANLYQEYGPEFVKKLNGMFAIAIWDKELRKLLLFRDRLGKKPLWYARTNKGLVFSSEIKGLLQIGVNKEIDTEAINDALIYGYCKSPNSPFLGIKQVNPGNYVVFERNEFQHFRYWSIEDQVVNSINEEDALEELKLRLHSAVEMRLNSERPLGVFLSGGIDSTIIAAIAQELTKGELNTFTAGFGSKNFDERQYANQVANELGTKHKIYEISPNPETILIDIAQICDQPFADSSIIASYLLAKYARQDVVVALGGDGGDEIFGGYDRYRAVLNSRFIRASLFRHIFSKDYLRNLGEFPYRISKMLQLDALDQRYDSLLRNIHPGELKKLITSAIQTQERDANQEWPQNRDLLLRKMQIDDINSYLPNDLMYKADMSSMAASLELRSPFLDDRVVEFGIQLPSRLKVSRSKGKLLLRRIASDYVSREIVDRPKKGFGVPRADWIRGPLREISSDLLFGNRTKSRGWTNSDYLQRLFEEHLKGRDRDRILWPALSLEMWARTWID